MVNTQFNFEKETPKFPKIFIKKKTQLIQPKPFKSSCQNIKNHNKIQFTLLERERERDHQVSPKFKANPIEISPNQSAPMLH